MPGGASGPATGGKPYTGPGGIALRVNGAPIGSPRSNLNLISSPGITWIGADDVPNARVNAQAVFRGEALLAEVAPFDAIPGGAVLVPLSGIAQAQLSITRIVAVLEAIAGAGTAPEFEAGTDDPGNPPNNDIALAQALTFATAGQEQALTLENPRPLITQGAPFDVLRIRQTVAATGFGTYAVSFKIFGAVVTP